MANCFDNLVSIRGACTETAATSGIYLDSYGVTLTECAHYVTGDYSSPEDFALKKISAAGQMIASELRNHFMNKMITTPLLDNNRVGHYLDNMQPDAALAATMKGVQFNIYSEKSFIDFYCDYIELFTDFTGNIDVKVYDLFQNKLLDTITVACTANQISRKVVGKKYTAYRHDFNIAFLYDASTVGSYKTTITGTNCGNCQGQNYFYNCNSYTQGRAVHIGTATSKISENMTGTSYTGGMSIGYALTCNYDLWLCSIGSLAALALAYKASALIMFAAMNEGKRINTATTINAEQLERKYKFFEDNYAIQMNNILPVIKIPTDNMCFECYDRVKTFISLP